MEPPENGAVAGEDHLLSSSSSQPTTSNKKSLVPPCARRMGTNQWIIVLVTIIALTLFIYQGMGATHVSIDGIATKVKTSGIRTSQNKNNRNDNDSSTITEGTGVKIVAFDSKGKELYHSTTPYLPTPKIKSPTEAITKILDDIVQYDYATDDEMKLRENATAVIGLGSTIVGEVDVEIIAEIVDAFLTPRPEWRIVAERFGNETSLSYDPAMHAPTTTTANNDVFTSPAITARSILLDRYTTNNKDANSNNNNNNEEIRLKQLGIDFLLVRVFDDKLSAFANAIRKYQFPDLRDCTKMEKATLGRTYWSQSGERDFLGAQTMTNTKALTRAFSNGLPYVMFNPKIWAWTYQFTDCTEPNGRHCAFLPMYGGKCMSSRIDPSVECMSKVRAGNWGMVVLPKNGIPHTVCQKALEQAPIPPSNFSIDTFRYNRVTAPALKDWCPHCSFGEVADIPTMENVSDPNLPLSTNQINSMTEPMPLRLDKRSGETICPMEFPPLQCGLNKNETCCFNEVKRPINVITNATDDARPTEDYMDSALSSFLTRFSRASRIRIDRLHRPRQKAMNERNVGWKEALSVGHCASIHIRRGDNLQRCESGQKRFCSMNLTLDDYMERAEPILLKLNNSKHVFVMTDDADVVSDEKLQPWKQKGYIIEVISGHNQYSTETYSDWDPFIESLHVAQACRAFLGHHISSVSLMVYRSICARFGECPITDRMRGAG